jgi:hypothetical protein
MDTSSQLPPSSMPPRPDPTLKGLPAELSTVIANAMFPTFSPGPNVYPSRHGRRPVETSVLDDCPCLIALSPHQDAHTTIQSLCSCWAPAEALKTCATTKQQPSTTRSTRIFKGNSGDVEIERKYTRTAPRPAFWTAANAAAARLQQMNANTVYEGVIFLLIAAT